MYYNAQERLYLQAVQFHGCIEAIVLSYLRSIGCLGAAQFGDSIENGTRAAYAKNRIKREMGHQMVRHSLLANLQQSSTRILASPLPVADWYNVFQSELIAEACLDRLVHNKSKRIELKGKSLRKKY